MKRWFCVMALGALSACGDGFFEGMLQNEPVADPALATEAETVAQPSTPPPPETASTVEDFDTTTAEQRQAAATTTTPAGERLLGTTIASLGSPTEPGFWLRTPLVGAAGKGRIVYEGRSAQVDLIPIEGTGSVGSRISLAAMRLIEAPLAGFPKIEVYSEG